MNEHKVKRIRCDTETKKQNESPPMPRMNILPFANVHAFQRLEMIQTKKEKEQQFTWQPSCPW